MTRLGKDLSVPIKTASGGCDSLFLPLHFLQVSPLLWNLQWLPIVCSNKTQLVGSLGQPSKSGPAHSSQLPASAPPTWSCRTSPRVLLGLDLSICLKALSTQSQSPYTFMPTAQTSVLSVPCNNNNPCVCRVPMLSKVLFQGPHHSLLDCDIGSIGVIVPFC